MNIVGIISDTLNMCLEKLKIPPEEYDCKIKTQKIWRFTIPIRGACSLIRCYARDLTKTGNPIKPLIGSGIAWPSSVRVVREVERTQPTSY